MRRSAFIRNRDSKGRYVAAYTDPLASDQPDDRIVVTTERGLCRLALAASEAGARFQRERLPGDAMRWMNSPLRLFGGDRAMLACLGREACLRAVLLHGLGLGLDVERALIDARMSHRGEGDGDSDRESGGDADGFGAEDVFATPQNSRAGLAGRHRLYTATIVDSRDDVMIQAFHASMAGSEGEVRRRLVGRYGPDVADVAYVRAGLNRSSPIVIALVPEAVVELIDRAARDVAASRSRRFGVDIHQCIQT